MTVFAKNTAGVSSAASKALNVTLIDNTGIEQNELKPLHIYAKQGQIVADLSGLIGATTVQVFNASGVIVKLQKTSDVQLSISVPTKGFYLVRVLNGGKQFTEKVVLF